MGSRWRLPFSGGARADGVLRLAMTPKGSERRDIEIAIAYGTGAVDARTMLREGAVLDLVGVAVLCVVCYVAFG